MVLPEGQSTRVDFRAWDSSELPGSSTWGVPYLFIRKWAEWCCPGRAPQGPLS
jgi:hypothetical protein